ncbi:MAG: DUF2894 domain-containing protein [Hydrogenophaga sp.]
MTEVATALPTLAMDELLARVEALRSLSVNPANAEPRSDPVRLHFIEALARRLQAAPPAVQSVLQVKLAEALTALGEGIESGAVIQQDPTHIEAQARAAPTVLLLPVGGIAATTAPRKPSTSMQLGATQPVAPLSLLGQLNQYIESATSNTGQVEVGNNSKAAAPTRSTELKSAQRFRETWALISAETEVDQAKHRAPENAGPLNAHNLVLRTLGLMRELSPDYLRRFMAHTESLMWLDQAVVQLKQPTGKAKSVKALKVKR